MYYKTNDEDLLPIINKIKELPDFVKTAEPLDHSTVPSDRFAYMEKKAFPCYDSASTYLSFCYYCINKDKVPDVVKNNIVKNASFFGVANDIIDFAKKFKAVENDIKEKEVNNSYALVEKKAYPINTKEQYYLANEHFDKHYKEYSIPERRTISLTISKKSNEFGIPILSKQAMIYTKSGDLSKTDLTAMDIASRALQHSKLPTNEAEVIKKAYLEMANGIVGGITKEADLHSTVTVLEGLDEMFGIRPNHKVKDPYSTVFNMFQKTAEEIIDVIKVGDISYPVSDMLSISPSVYENAFGKDFIDSVSSSDGNIDKAKFRDIIQTFPKDEMDILKSILDSYLSEKGIEEKI